MFTPSLRRYSRREWLRENNPQYLRPLRVATMPTASRTDHLKNEIAYLTSLLALNDVDLFISEIAAEIVDLTHPTIEYKDVTSKI